MKKLSAIILAIIMFAVTMAPAYVEERIEAGTQDINIAFIDVEGNPVTVERIYSVDITFNAELENPLTWTAIADAESIVWDPAKHAYTSGGFNDVRWTVPQTINDAITIVNHSNEDVVIFIYFEGDNQAEEMAGGASSKKIIDTVAPKFTDGSGITLELQGTGEDGGIKNVLESADKVALGNPEDADSETVKLVPGGTPENISAGGAAFVITKIVIDVQSMYIG